MAGAIQHNLTALLPAGHNGTVCAGGDLEYALSESKGVDDAGRRRFPEEQDVFSPHTQLRYARKALFHAIDIATRQLDLSGGQCPSRPR